MRNVLLALGLVTVMVILLILLVFGLYLGKPVTAAFVAGALAGFVVHVMQEFHKRGGTVQR